MSRRGCDSKVQLGIMDVLARKDSSSDRRKCRTREPAPSQRHSHPHPSRIGVPISIRCGRKSMSVFLIEVNRLVLWSFSFPPPEPAPYQNHSSSSDAPNDLSCTKHLAFECLSKSGVLDRSSYQMTWSFCEADHYHMPLYLPRAMLSDTAEPTSPIP